eukprot:362674-Chlamydomonas_euryale.AAC.2
MAPETRPHLHSHGPVAELRHTLPRSQPHRAAHTPCQRVCEPPCCTPIPARPWVGCRRSWAGPRTGRAFGDRRAPVARRVVLPAMVARRVERRGPRTAGRGPATVWRPV